MVVDNLARRVTPVVTRAFLPFHHPIGERISSRSERMDEEEKFRWEPAPDPDSIAIPGLNAAASAADQIEQIDQLITLKLQVAFVGACLAAADNINLSQKIDGQFAKIQWLAEHKLLPAVKRYSNGVQPVREAARVSTIRKRVGRRIYDWSFSVLGAIL